jgi:D-hydroxyproline dehydrogenase subunit gamma
MADRATLLTLWVNGQAVPVAEDVTVAAALLQSNIPCRTSVTGEPRTALCGMGICFECRAVVDDIAHTRTCQLLCRDGMRVETQP